MNQLNMFARARAGLALTPTERMALKAIQAVVLTAILAAATAVAQIPSTGTVDWRKVGVVGGIAFLTSMLAAANKFFSAHLDGTPLAPLAAIGQVATLQATQVLAGAEANEAHADVSQAPAPVAAPAMVPVAPGTFAPAAALTPAPVPASVNPTSAGFTATVVTSAPAAQPPDAPSAAAVPAN